jgi:hypothetical protein
MVFSCLEYWECGTVLRFFIGKMDQEMVVFWSKTEIMGQFSIFYLTQMTQKGQTT